MKVRYETVVDDIGNWDCFLVLIDEDGFIVRVEDDVKSEREHRHYKPMSRLSIDEKFDQIVDELHLINKQAGRGIFYLISVAPCTGERSWFIPVCQKNGIDNYEILSACWEM